MGWFKKSIGVTPREVVQKFLFRNNIEKDDDDDFIHPMRTHENNIINNETESSNLIDGTSYRISYREVLGSEYANDVRAVRELSDLDEAGEFVETEGVEVELGTGYDVVAQEMPEPVEYAPFDSVSEEDLKLMHSLLSQLKSLFIKNDLACYHDLRSIEHLMIPRLDHFKKINDITTELEKQQK